MRKSGHFAICKRPIQKCRHDKLEFENLFARVESWPVRVIRLNPDSIKSVEFRLHVICYDIYC